MGINIKNNTRLVNAKLGRADLNKYGNNFAVQFGLDGINIANVTVQPMPNSIIPYLEGDDTITQYAVPINVDELCDYALASFPNIEELTLFSLDIVSVEDHLSYLSKLKIMYVNQNNLSGYSWFPTTIHSEYESFTSVDDYIGYVVVYNALPYIVNENNKNDLEIVAGTTIAYDKYLTNMTVDYTYEIKDYTQDHKLTSAIITEQLNALTSIQRNAITKLIIASSYTSSSAESVAWGYTFGTLLPYLNNNVWYNSVKYDFTTRELSGVDELLESDITNLINGISSDKLSGVTQLKFSGFSDMSAALTYDYEDLPNLEYVWLDNVRYEVNELLNGYVIVEYIQSSGTQYINTGILSGTKDKIELEFSSTVSIPSEQRYIFGFYKGTPTNKNVRAGFWENQVYTACNFVYDYTGTLGIGTKIKATTSNLENIFVGNEYALFGSKNANTGNVVSINAKLYYCKIEKDNVLTNNFIPVYRVSDNEIGLYDLVNNVFYTNNGTGTFTKGSAYYPSTTYFYPLSSIEQEYNANLNQTFYLDYNGTLPSYPNYQLTYYTDINCTTSILPANLVSGTRYYVKCSGLVGVDFANDSWDTIKQALEGGYAQYQLGDTKTITYNNDSYTIRICDIGARYDITNGNGAKNKATFEFVELVGTNKMNESGTNNGGFALSYMKTTLLPNIYNNLPSDLKAVISQVEISSASDGSASGSGSLSYSSNYLFLPNAYELTGLINGSNELEQTTRYGLYSSNDYLQKTDVGGNIVSWWLRSPSAGSATSFLVILSQYKSVTGYWAATAFGIAPFFCI